ncbi:MAG: hypothetical protein LUO88_02425 [Methanoregulaceae archaeon]|nr:hypothetical protein [Methanoregulaceae archaeon]
MLYYGQCPSCGEESELEPVPGGKHLVRCTFCGAVHREQVTREPVPREVKTIVSREDRSRVCTIEVLEGEEVAVGDRFVAECGDEGIGVEITAIETGGRRVDRIGSALAETLWAREIDRVIVRISVHDGWKTIPLELETVGEEIFEVGEVRTAGRKRFRISHIKLRDGAVLRKEGWRTVAAKIKRVYGNVA